MNVYLLRHGIAEETPAGGRDEDRELTDEGRQKLSDLLHRVAKAGVKPDTIVTSPYKRALQTAKLAAKILDGPGPIDNDALVPHGTPRGVWNEIRSYGDSEDVLLASHEPLLSHAVSYLLNAPSLKIEMKKGALVAIEFSSLRGEPHGILRWMMVPKLCS